MTPMFSPGDQGGGGMGGRAAPRQDAAHRDILEGMRREMQRLQAFPPPSNTPPQGGFDQEQGGGVGGRATARQDAVHRDILEAMRREMQRLKGFPPPPPVSTPPQPQEPSSWERTRSFPAYLSSVPPSPAHSTATAGDSSVTNNATNPSVMRAAQWAVQEASRRSAGCFVSQNSWFGNLILPVLPRIQDDSSST